MKLSPLHDADNSRQQRNMTTSQRRANITTKEGVVVNSFIKETLSYIEKSKSKNVRTISLLFLVVITILLPLSKIRIIIMYGVCK